MTPGWALGGLALSAFTSATVLPGNSEVVLLAVLSAFPELSWSALAVATLFNTLGGMTSWWLGKLLPRKELSPRIARWVTRGGPLSMLLSGLPFIGDAFVLAAGWLRLPMLSCTLWMALGKGLRYLALLGLFNLHLF